MFSLKQPFICLDWDVFEWIVWSQVHREIQQRSPISGSRRPSITSMLSSTIGNTSLIAAQVKTIKVAKQQCKNLDTGPGGENAHRAKKCWPDDIQMKIMISPYQFIEILQTCVLRSSRTLKAKSVKSQGNKSSQEFGKIGNISNPGKAEASLELKFGSWSWSPT